MFAKYTRGICFGGRMEIDIAGDRVVAHSRMRGFVALVFSSSSSDAIAYLVPREISPVRVCTQARRGLRRADSSG